MIKVFLIEDEPPAMRKLERLVAGVEDMQVCGTAATCANAIEGIQRTKPQLLIVDVQLPDGTGFEVLQAIDEDPPHAIFLTAYDHYAVQAFGVAALDYLLKPVSQARFLDAIQRFRERTPSVRNHARRFLVERLKAAYLLPVESIHRITADRNYALLYSDMGEFALRATMDSLEQRLDPGEFVRVSRSAIVRIAAIREVRRRDDDPNPIIVLTTGDEVVCSKRYWTAALDQIL